jgi:hypothetical protein
MAKKTKLSEKSARIPDVRESQFKIAPSVRAGSGDSEALPLYDMGKSRYKFFENDHYPYFLMCTILKLY